jgi:hypothetical protein
MMNGPMNSMLEPRRPAWSRPEAVFIVAALALLGAFLVPMSPAVLAVLWVCTFCLAGAVTIICVAAGSSSDLIGFVPLVSGLTLLRLAALAGSARRIIQQEPADPLLQATGGFLANQWPLGAVLICLLMAVIVSAVVFAASQKIALASTGYIHRILPLKRVGLETDVRMGVIDEAQAQTLARRLVSEFRFSRGCRGRGFCCGVKRRLSWWCCWRACCCRPGRQGPKRVGGGFYGAACAAGGRAGGVYADSAGDFGGGVRGDDGTGYAGPAKQAGIAGVTAGEKDFDYRQRNGGGGGN